MFANSQGAREDFIKHMNLKPVANPANGTAAGKDVLRIDQFIKENKSADKSDPYEYDREFDQNMDQTDKQMQYL